MMFFTANRSEYGLLSSVIKKIITEDDVDYKLIVSGAHLLEKYGNTITEIENDNIDIHYKVETSSSGADSLEIINDTTTIIKGVANILNNERPDYLFVLGDRYESFAAAQAAFFMQIPIAHSGGGNITEGGCFDDTIRHAITKLASLHFVSCTENADNLKKLGEESWRIIVSGSTAVDVALSNDLYGKNYIQNKIGISFDSPVIVFTLHPTAVSADDLRSQLQTCLRSLKELGYTTIITYPNPDIGGGVIIDEYEKWQDIENFVYINNLGHKLYLSLLKYASVIVGNSSSGLLEAPIFGVPAVNIGMRQKGRVRAANVIDCNFSEDSIKKAIAKSLNDKDFLGSIKEQTDLFGKGTASDFIVDALKKHCKNESLLFKKLI